MIEFKETFYITTAIDYVNAPPHIGHLYEKLCADVLARFNRLKGKDVFFLTGTDENAQKNEKAAKEAGIEVRAFVEENSRKFMELCKAFDVSNDDFIRTTEKRHVDATQLIFKKLFDNGDIYKGYYEGYYCQGCEEFKTEKDLIEGKCPEHGTKPEWLKEESYFFKLSKYQDKIMELLTGTTFVLPEVRRNEIVARIREDGLRDLSVSRPNAAWGIDTPIDKNHKIYVWIDALVNYISALDYDKGEKFKKYWPADIHLVGKGINWFHSVIWPALLMSAKIPLPKLILVHGYLTAEGKKISKSLGNAINPLDLAKKYQIDAIRYFLLKEIPFGEDGDFNEKALVEKNNNELVATIGNFIYRVLSFIQTKFSGRVPEPEEFGEPDYEFEERTKEIGKDVGESLEEMEIDKALKKILDFSGYCNQYFQKCEPWKDEEKAKTCLYLCANAVRNLAVLLEPFVPSSSQNLWRQLNLPGSVSEQEWDLLQGFEIISGHEIGKPEILFKKVEDLDIDKK